MSFARMPGAESDDTVNRATYPPVTWVHATTRAACAISRTSPMRIGPPGTSCGTSAAFSRRGAGNDTSAKAASVGARKVAGTDAAPSSAREGICIGACACAVANKGTASAMTAKKREIMIRSAKRYDDIVRDPLPSIGDLS
jgi:hypothetical protein